MRILAVLLLAGHGIAHLVGFLVPWKLVQMEEMPYSTTILGGAVDLGDSGIRVLGILWLLVGLAFIVGAAALFFLWPWWRVVILFLSVVSLILCVIGWPEAKIGLVVNGAILVFLLLGGGSAWME